MQKQYAQDEYIKKTIEKALKYRLADPEHHACDVMFSTRTQAAQNLRQGKTTDIGHLDVHCV